MTTVGAYLMAPQGERIKINHGARVKSANSAGRDYSRLKTMRTMATSLHWEPGPLDFGARSFPGVVGFACDAFGIPAQAQGIFTRLTILWHSTCDFASFDAFALDVEAS